VQACETGELIKIVFAHKKNIMKFEWLRRKVMKRLLMLVTFMMFTLALGTNGFAVPITIQVNDLIQFANPDGPNAFVSAGMGGPFTASSPSSEWASFLTFCLETNEDLSFHEAFTVAGISTEAQAGGAGGQDTSTGDTLDSFSAYLYHQAVSGVYDVNQLDDVQYALWYQEGEISLSSLSGDAQGFYTAELANYGSSGWSGLGKVRVLNLVDSSGARSQDVLVEVSPIPEPATMLLLGAGLIGLVGVGRTKLFKRG
jgi:hypothetical protein